jgi:hypothetical protein
MKRASGGLDWGRVGAVADRRGEARSPGRARRFCSLSRALAGVAIAALLLLDAHPTAAVDPEPAPPPSAPDPERTSPPPGPGVDLDRLLKLPDSFNKDQTGRRGGATRPEWQSRFAEARAAIDEAETGLKRAEQELDDMANDSSSWNVAAPGATDPQSGPISFRLREEIRRQREEKERAEKELRALGVRADMLGVPADWRVSEQQRGE